MVAPTTVKSAADKPVISPLKIKVRIVVLTEPLVPLAVRELKLNVLVETFAATVLLDGVKINPDLATATVKFEPLATVIPLTPKV